MRYASGSGFESWDLVGSLAAPAVGALFHLCKIYRNRRMQKKGRSSMTGTRKAKYGKRSKRHGKRTQKSHYALQAVESTLAGVSGDLLAS